MGLGRPGADEDATTITDRRALRRHQVATGTREAAQMEEGHRGGSRGGFNVSRFTRVMRECELCHQDFCVSSVSLAKWCERCKGKIAFQDFDRRARRRRWKKAAVELTSDGN